MLLKPIIFKNSQTLIVSSFPTTQSFRNRFYYSAKNSQFWTILENITEYPINNKDQKIWLLKKSKLALWYIIRSQNLESSIDLDITNTEVNALDIFLQKYPTIKTIAFTDEQAATIFELHFAHLDIERVYLPSQLSSFLKFNLDEKINIYKERLEL